jgi:hypothetical protein
MNIGHTLQYHRVNCYQFRGTSSPLASVRKGKNVYCTHIKDATAILKVCSLSPRKARPRATEAGSLRPGLQSHAGRELRNAPSRVRGRALRGLRLHTFKIAVASLMCVQYTFFPFRTLARGELVPRNW